MKLPQFIHELDAISKNNKATKKSWGKVACPFIMNNFHTGQFAVKQTFWKPPQRAHETAAKSGNNKLIKKS